ncbi:MAG: efflux RND transporter periplasmic adaptor subunit [Myxococcota bacterium]
MRQSVAKALAFAGVAAVVGVVLILGPDAYETSPPSASAAEPQDSSDRDEPAPVTIFAARTDDLSTHLTATANLEAEDSIAVVSEAAGRVTAVHAEEGDEVEAGGLLVALNAKHAKMAVREAQLRADQAKRKRTRADKIADHVSGEEREQLSSDGQLAAHALEQAKLDLSRTRIRAPRRGEVTARKVTLGQYVRVGDELLDITDFSVLVARIHVPERDASALEPGRSVDLQLQADSEVKLVGTIRAIASVVDTASGTVKVTIEVRDPPESVRSGSFVTVSMLRDSVSAATWIPREAVIAHPRGAHVFVLSGEQVGRRPVELGVEDKGRLQIVSGVSPGEEVVLSGHGDLEDGAAVTVLPQTD